jgi:hypothetical protein
LEDVVVRATEKGKVEKEEVRIQGLRTKCREGPLRVCSCRSLGTQGHYITEFQCPPWL